MDKLEALENTNENTSIATTPPNPYPIHLTLPKHPFIDEIEIPIEFYIRIKIRGEWFKLYLPIFEPNAIYVKE